MIKKGDVDNFSKQLSDQVQEFDTSIKKFRFIIDSINDAWNGADALNYVNIMREKYAISLTEIKDILKDYEEYLNLVPEAYSTLDETFASKHIEV